MKSRKVAAYCAALLTATLVTPGVAMADEGGTEAPAAHQVLYTGEAGSSFGSALSRVSCDVNGDEIDDVLAGDSGWIREPFKEVGAGYVLLGSKSATGGDLSEPGDAGAVRLDGRPVEALSGAWFGLSVSCLGDVNGDGLDDVAVGAGSRRHHEVAVVFGAREFGPLDLDNLGDRGYLISDSMANDVLAADKATDNFGYWVGGAGDVDGDGRDDVVIGDLLADYNGRSNSGRVWVVRGLSSPENIDVQNSDKVLMTIDGARASARTAAADSAGDVNGDGRDDLVVGAYSDAPWGASVAGAGAAHVVFGGAASSVDLAAPGSSGFTIAGPTRGSDRLGMSTAALGDIDGDGLSDVIVGADGSSVAREGGAAVVLGAVSAAPVMVDPDGGELTVYSCTDGALDTSCAASEKVRRGYWINGASAGSKAGFSVAGLPDVNGDDVPDAVIGSYGEGAAYVLHSDPSRAAALDLGDLTAAQGERHVSSVEGGAFGRVVGSAGDFDANGAPDLMVGGQGNRASVVLRGALNTALDLAVTTDALVGEPVAVTATLSTLIGSAPTEHLDGTLAISRDGQLLDGLEAVAVVDGIGTFTVPGDTAGSHELSAVFAPAHASAHQGAEGARAYMVDKRAITGRLSLDARLVTSGSDVEAVFTTSARTADEVGFEVSFELDGRPVVTGLVVDGEATAVLSGLTSGAHTVRVTHPGNHTFRPFSTPEATLEVVKQTTEVAKVTLSSSSTVYGGSPVTASVYVPGGHGGEVAFYDNLVLMGTAPVAEDGNAQWRIDRPPAGRHQISARFLGSEGTQASMFSAEAALDVAKAQVGIVRVSGKAFKRATRPKVTVVVGRLDNGSFPVGVVSVRSGSRIHKVQLTAAMKGRAVLRLTKSMKSIKVGARFNPSDPRNITAPHASAKVRIKSRR